MNSNFVQVFESMNLKKENRMLQYDTGLYDQKITEDMLPQYQAFVDSYVGHTVEGEFEPSPHLINSLEGGHINPIPVEWIKKTIILIVVNGETSKVNVPPQFVSAALDAKADIQCLSVGKLDGEWAVVDGHLDEGEWDFDTDGIEIYDEFVPLAKGITNEKLRESIVYSPSAYFPAIVKYGEKEEIDFRGREQFFQYVAARLADQIESQPIEELILTLKYLKNEEYIEAEDRTPVNEVVYPVYSRVKNLTMRLAIDSDKEAYLYVRSKERIVSSATSLDGNIFSAKTMSTLFMMSLTCGRSVDNQQIGGWSEAVSNMWQVTNNNYGREPEFMEPLSIMRRNMMKCVTAQATDTFEGAKRWPYFQLVSAPFDASVLGRVAEQGIPMMPDKQSSQYLVYGAGAEAMGVFYRTVQEATKQICTFGNTAMSLAIDPTEDCGFYILSFETAVRKLFNRHSQAYGSSMADTTNPEFFPILASKMGNLTSEGISYFHGWPMRCVVTNDFLCDGSGPIFTRKDWFDPSDGTMKQVYRPYGIRKSIKFSVSPHQLPASVKEHYRSKAMSKGKGSEWLLEAKADLQKIIQKVEGKKFGEGETIITLFGSNKYFKRELAVNSKHNQEIRVLEGATIEASADYNKLDVTIPVILDGEDCLIKWRGPGIKGVSSPKSDITFEVWDVNPNQGSQLSDEDYSKEFDFVNLLNDPAKGWELYFPYESLKAQEARKVMFCHAMGGGVVDANIITLTDGSMVDISHPDSIFSIWLEENTHTVLVTRCIARHHYNEVVLRNPDFVVNGQLVNDFEILEEDYRSVTLRYPVQVLFGEMTLGMEISSPREATGRQSFSAETVSVMSSFDFISASKLYANSAEYHEAVISAISMLVADSSVDQSLPVLGFDSHSDFFDMLFYTKNGVEIQRSGREVFQQMARMYPEGCYISLDTVEFFINAKAFMSIGSFGSGGQSIGIASDVIDLFIALSVLPEERGQEWEASTRGNLARVRSGWKTLCGHNERKQGMTDSSSLLKRLGRTDQFSVAGKVLTSSNPLLHHEEGVELPKVMFHPECEMVKMLGLDPGQMTINLETGETGEIVTMGRVPMTMRGWFQIIIHEEGQVAYASVLPECVSMLHEGDGDGDGEDTAKDDNVTIEKALANNRDIMSFGGYSAVYPNIMDQTLSEFMSIKDAWTKKLISPGQGKIVDGKIVSFSKVPSFVKVSDVQKKYVHPFQQVRFMPCQSMAEAGVKISSHYKFNVGVGYGWASYLSFKTAEVKHGLASQLAPAFLSLMKVKNPELAFTRAEGVLNEGNQFQVKGQTIESILSSIRPDFLQAFEAAHSSLFDYKLATTYAWRIAYEGNGLSGYTPQASAFFGAIKFCAQRTSFKPNAMGVVPGVHRTVVPVQITEDGEMIVGIDPDPKPDDLRDFGVDIVDYMYEQHGVPAMVTEMLLEAELVRSSYSRIERYGWKAAFNKFGEYAMQGAIYGALRRMTGGDSIVDPLFDIFGSGMESCFSVISAKTDNGCGDLSNPILSGMLQKATAVHTAIAESKQKALGDPYAAFFGF